MCTGPVPTVGVTHAGYTGYTESRNIQFFRILCGTRCRMITITPSTPVGSFKVAVRYNVVGRAASNTLALALSRHERSAQLGFLKRRYQCLIA